MLKQKDTIRPNKGKSNLLGIGVFLVAIVLIWFASFKLIGGERSESDIRIFDFGSKEDIEIKPIFSDSSDYPVLIMFDNHPDAQIYQSGLSEALVVYEVLAEGGATRFAGIYAGAPDLDRIGPVRSARPYIVDIASGWSAFFWHAGGSPEALDLIKITDVIDLNEISGLGIRYFWRDNDVPRPHNLFTSSDLIALGIEDFELTSLPREKLLWNWDESNSILSTDLEEGDIPATSIYVDFSEEIDFDASYEYDFENFNYKRSMGGIAHKDNVTNKQITPANIIIQRVPAEGYYPSGYGRIKIDMEGTGEMILFQYGKVILGTWKKEARNSQTEWFNAQGEPITLVLGQTWVELLPGKRVVSYE